MPSADSQDYLWIAVGDIHDEPERFAKIPELSQADGIIVTGDLTIKGITKPVSFPVTVKTTANGAEATGTITVDRSKYDMKFRSKSFFDASTLGDKMIYDDFTIDVKLVAAK